MFIRVMYLTIHRMLFLRILDNLLTLILQNIIILLGYKAHCVFVYKLINHMNCHVKYDNIFSHDKILEK